MQNILDEKVVRELIPQKKPFVMIDSLVEYSDNITTTRFCIKEDNLFIENNAFNESGMIENMAQTIALHTGYYFYLRKEISPKGYIGSVKDVVVKNLPSVGSSIETKVEILQEFMGVTLVNGVVSCNGEVLLTAQMKTVLEKN